MMNDISLFVTDKNIKKFGNADNSFLMALRRQKKRLMDEFVDFGRSDGLGKPNSRHQFSFFLDKIEAVLTSFETCDILTLRLPENENIVQIGGEYYNLESILEKNWSDNEPESPDRRNDINIYQLDDEEMDQDRRKQNLVLDNIFFSAMSSAQVQEYTEAGTVSYRKGSYHRGVEIKLKNFFSVSIPMTHNQKYIAPLLFLEHVLTPQRVIQFHGAWNCCPDRCSLRILTDVVSVRLDELLEDQTNVCDCSPGTDTGAMDQVQLAVYDVLTKLSELQGSGNGFVHGNLTTASVGRQYVVNKPEFMLLEVEHSSFYLNGFRFYSPLKATAGMDDGFFRNYTFKIQTDLHTRQSYFELYNFNLNEIEGIPGMLARVANKLFMDNVNDFLGEITEGITSFFDIGFEGGTQLNMLNEIIIRNNPVTSVSGSYDVYSFLCSLFSEDYLYVNVMQYISANAAHERVDIDEQKCRKHKIGNAGIKARRKLLFLWKSLWFKDQRWTATQQITERGRTRTPFLNISEINDFLNKFKLKVNLDQVYLHMGVVPPGRPSQHQPRTLNITATNKLCLGRPVTVRDSPGLECNIGIHHKDYQKIKFSD